MPLFLCARQAHARLLIGIEGPQPEPAPPGSQIGRTGAIVGSMSELIGEPEERPEQGGAIIVDQLDQSSLLDEAAEFDEMAGAGATVLHPLPLVVAGLAALDPIPQHGQMPEHDCCRPQCCQQCRRVLFSSPACPLAERRFGRVRPTSRRLRTFSWIARRLR